MVRLIKILKILFEIVRWCLPWAIRAARHTFWLMMVGFVSLWLSFPQAVKRTANEWVDMAVEAGFPTLWAHQLYKVLCVVAFLTAVAGWIVLSLFTVFVLDLVV